MHNRKEYLADTLRRLSRTVGFVGQEIEGTTALSSARSAFSISRRFYPLDLSLDVLLYNAMIYVSTIIISYNKQADRN